MSFTFGEFELDRSRRQLLREGEPVPLEPKAYELLCLLVERRPRALSRTQIRDVVWANTFVAESTLARVVNGIRQALGDDARQPRFIRTLHGFGYAFCGDARESKTEGPETREPPAAEAEEAAELSRSVEAVEGARIGRTGSARRWRTALVLTAIAGALGAAWVGLRPTRSTEAGAAIPRPRLVPLTSLPGAELHPALSPDGKRVAFAWNGPDRDNFDVYVKDVASGEMVRVTRDPALDDHPAWSPDGEHLAFLRRLAAEAAIYLVPATGGREQRLAEIATPPALFSQRVRNASSLDWSPDGRYVATSDRVTDGTWGITLVSVETGAKHTLTANAKATTIDLFPTFSPDGRRVAFLRWSLTVIERPDLLVQPFSSEWPPQARGHALVLQGVDPGAIAWLPSGDEILVRGQRLALDGSPPRPFDRPGAQLALDTGPLASAVSVRGRRLVSDSPELRPQLVRLALPGATKATPTRMFPSTRGEAEPAIAPDGRRVVFASRRAGDTSLWIGETDGSDCRPLPLPIGSTEAGSPSWSPDGRRLAFDAGSGHSEHVYIATPEGGTLRRLTGERTSDARPRWSRDGRFVYFASTRGGGGWQIWKVPAEVANADARAVQITRSGGMEAEESADGRYVYYAKRGVAGLFRMALAAPGGPEEKVLDFGGEGRWHLGARGIFTLDLGSGPPTIRFHDLGRGTSSKVLELPPLWEFDLYGGAFTVSPDERWALVTTVQTEESDILLLDGFR
jgi:Tol biopolymer transport system component/DNA-binding winged helix-turn-helix (wHTH) protein